MYVWHTVVFTLPGLNHSSWVNPGWTDPPMDYMSRPSPPQDKPFMKGCHLSHCLLLSLHLQHNLSLLDSCLATESKWGLSSSNSQLCLSIKADCAIMFILLVLHCGATSWPGKTDIPFSPPKVPSGKWHMEGFLLLDFPSLHLISSPSLGVGWGGAMTSWLQYLTLLNSLLVSNLLYAQEWEGQWTGFLPCPSFYFPFLPEKVFALP